MRKRKWIEEAERCYDQAKRYAETAPNVDLTDREKSERFLAMAFTAALIATAKS